jgi:hypothetical protein
LKCFRFRVFSFFWLLSLIIVLYNPHFLLFFTTKTRSKHDRVS